MTGYDTSYKKDVEGGYTLKVFMHWDDGEIPPRNRKEALNRLVGMINLLENIMKEAKD